MINQFKMDLHRFMTNKVMYVLLLVYCAFEIFGIFMMSQYEQPAEDGGMTISMMNQSEFMQSVLSQTPSWVMLYIAVFTVYFSMSEYNAGFYKNVPTMKKSRTQAVLSKVLIQAIFTAMIFAVSMISDLIGRGIFFENTSLGDWGYLIKLLVGQFLLHWAFSVVILCLTMYSRSMLISLILSFVVALNVIGMSLGALEGLLDNINVTQYFLVNTITSPMDLNQTENMVHILFVALVSLLLFSFISLRYKQKEDLH